jgi:acyl-homoserine lactone acylase PvdQ
MLSRKLGAGAVAMAALALASTPAEARDYADTALNIIPSGQYGAVPPPRGADEQARMYDGLTPLFDRVAETDLRRFFKSEALNDPSVDGPVTRARRLRRGVTLRRDRFGVPFIKATSQSGAVWGAGWVIAQDRSLLLEQARYNSRVAAVGVPGLDALPLITRLRSFEPSRATEREIAKQTRVLRRAGSRGRRLLRDIDTYVDGINASLRAQKSEAEPWTRNDIYALNALKGEFLGQGGGDEARRSQLLDGLTDRLGAGPGKALFNDLRNLDDPESSATVSRRFEYALKPSNTSGNVVLDNGSYRPTPAATLTQATAASAGASAAADGRATHASNILMVAGDRSTTGRPLFVGGPQIGYFYPGLTLEIDIEAPGMKTRGVTSAPFPGYMLIGRGEDFAWTLTSTGSDIIDTYAETLCGGSTTRYRYKGRCRSMQTFDAGVLKGSGGQRDQRARFRRTVHGPVVGYGTVNGRRVALAQKRSSYGRDTLDQLFFQELTYGRVTSPRSFARAAALTPQTFNAFYADDDEVSMFTTGRLPLRHPNVDSGLPTKGTGEYEWRGYLPSGRHAQEIKRSGVMVNWNNKPAQGWVNGDTEWFYGSVQRNELLERNLATRPKHDLASVVGAMNAGATQDPRGVDLVPTLAAVLSGSPAPSARAQAMLDQLVAWNAAGGSRLDVDLDGKIDHPGVAVMDAAWPKLADAAMSPALGPQLEQLADIEGRFDLPPSGMFGGWQHYVDKDLRTLLGQQVRAPYRTRFCGAGDLARCRADLWAAMEAAGNELATAQGADVTAWRSDAKRERIKFVPGLLPTEIRYTNRPSGIQQVISFDGHRPRR